MRIEKTRHFRPSSIRNPKSAFRNRIGGDDYLILDAFKLDGKTALVTGASAGLGAAIAVALAEAGADVACHGNTRSPDATCEEIRSLGRVAHPLTGDLSKSETPRAIFVETLEAFGR